MKIDWLKARIEYIKDPTLSLERLAEKYDVAQQTMRKMSAEEGWVEMRDEFQAEVNRKVTENLPKVADVKAERLAEKSSKRSKNWEILRNQLMALIVNIPIFDKEGKQIPMDESQVGTRARVLNVIIASMKDVNLGERLEDGQPLNIEKSSIDFDSNKEEFDKIKESLGLTDEDFKDKNLEATMKKIANYYEQPKTTIDERGESSPDS